MRSNIEALINSERYFQFSSSLNEVHDKHIWLNALSNNSESRIMVHKIELYWDGGEVTLINKRELLLGLFAGFDLIKDAANIGNFKEVEFFKSEENNYHGLLENEDTDRESFYPIGFGKTDIKPYIILEPNESLFIGASSKVTSGNLSIVVKGWLYDTEKE